VQSGRGQPLHSGQEPGSFVAGFFCRSHDLSPRHGEVCVAGDVRWNDRRDSGGYARGRLFDSLRMTDGRRGSIASLFENTQGRLRSFDFAQDDIKKRGTGNNNWKILAGFIQFGGECRRWRCNLTPNPFPMWEGEQSRRGKVDLGVLRCA
jgi:hypothetical protein